MRRSRASLILFFGTFTTLLMAVGFADGGHQSLGRPADVYRQDLDDVVDGWSGYCSGPIDTCADSTSPAASASPPGSSGWIMVPLAGSPLSLVLYIEDEVACQLSCDDQWQNQLPTSALLTVAQQDHQACTLDDLDAAMAEIAEFSELGQQFGCDDFVCGLPTESAAAESPASNDDAATSSGSDDPPAGDDLALDVAAACAGLPGPAAWQLAVDRASRCDFVWEGCDSYPNGAVDGWLARRDLVPSAEAWREIGRVASQLLSQISQQRDTVLATTTRQLANWFSTSLTSQAQTARQPAVESEPSWPRTGRTPGLLLAL